MSEFTQEQWEELSTLLDPAAQKHTSMRLDEVQAFVMALVSGPDAMNVSLWLPEITANAPFTSEQEASIARLVTLMAEYIQSCFQQGRVPDLLVYTNTEGVADVYAWCNAYLYAVDVAPSDWFAVENEELEDLFYPIMALGGVYDAVGGEPAILEIDSDEQVQLSDQLPQVVLDIYRYHHQTA